MNALKLHFIRKNVKEICNLKKGNDKRKHFQFNTWRKCLI